jgi:LacI family transcriptional regulator
VGADPKVTTGRRLAAFRATARRLLPDAPAPVVLLGDFSIQWGEVAGARLATESPAVDGVVCGNDLIALGVLRALRVRGAEVPGDVAVTGFDDVGFAAVADPPLTTARQPITAIGEHCVRLLLSRIAGDDRARVDVSLGTELVMRASTGRATALSTPGSAGAKPAIHRGTVS